MSVLSRLVDAFAFLQAFALARWGYRFSDRAHFERWQQRKLANFLHNDIAAVPFFACFKELNMESLPIMSKSEMRRSFAALNRYGIDLDTAQEVGLRAERERDFKPMLPGSITVGLSSGTSGQRGVFLVSNRERSVWAGTVMARALSKAALRHLINPFAEPLRVAFFLRANSNLYTTLKGVRLNFQFGDLLQPFTELIDGLNALQPHLLIAPASVLRQLARAQQNGKLAIQPVQVISVAEVLESDDEQEILKSWGVRTDQIYQCTEGFLGYTCSGGRLHLNEELIHFEMEWQDTDQQRFVPIITDFSRRTQIFVRYRLDDILRIEAEPCSCGRVTRCLSAIEGRQDDVLWLPDSKYNSDQNLPLLSIFPDVIRRAFLMTRHQFTDYRLEQYGMDWQVRLDMANPSPLMEQQVREELSAVCHRAGSLVPEIHFSAWEPPEAGQKRRRIRCMMPPQSLYTSS